MPKGKKNPYPDEGVMKIIGKHRGLKPIEWTRTGIHTLDLLLGGGVPTGKIIEVFGTEAAGKSLLAWMIAKVWQSKGGIVILLDVESSAPEKFMKALGVNTDMVIAPVLDGTIEDIRDQLKKIIKELREEGFDGPILVIHDSVAQTTSVNEFEDFKALEAKEHSMGARAKAFSEFFRQDGKFFYSEGVTFLALNQIREKIGVMFGKNYDSPGGKALKFFASLRIEMNRGKRITKDDMTVGYEVRVNAIKNKCAPDGRKCTLFMMNSRGFDAFGGLDEVLVQTGRVTQKKGSNSLFVGDEEFKTAQEAVTAHPELLDNWEGTTNVEEAVAG